MAKEKMPFELAKTSATTPVTRTTEICNADGTKWLNEELSEKANANDVPSVTLSDRTLIVDGEGIEIPDGYGFVPDNAQLRAINSGIQKGSSEGSIEEGKNTVASGAYSHAEGEYTVASGTYSHAEGYGTSSHNNIASGEASHTEGEWTIASGEAAHAEGYNNESIGDYSHTEGSSNKSYSDNCHTEGTATTAGGVWDGDEIRKPANKMNSMAAHAEGMLTNAVGRASHAEGYYTITNNEGEHAQGIYNASHTNADTTKTEQITIHSVGIGTSYPNRKNAHEIMKDGTHYFGDGKLYKGTYGGSNNKEIVPVSLSENNTKITVGDTTVSLGGGIQPSTESGGQTTALTKEQMKVVNTSIRSGTGSDSIIEGDTGTATMPFAHAEGKYTIATGTASHAEGTYTQTYNYGEHAEGRYNVSHTNTDTTKKEQITIHSVGNGDTSARSNAHEIMMDGSHYLGDGKVFLRKYEESKINDNDDLATILGKLTWKKYAGETDLTPFEDSEITHDDYDKNYTITIDATSGNRIFDLRSINAYITININGYTSNETIIYIDDTYGFEINGTTTDINEPPSENGAIISIQNDMVIYGEYTPATASDETETTEEA